MIFTLEVLPAKKGDCLLLHWGDPADRKIIIIDGGPNTVYEKVLRPRLLQLAESRGAPLDIQAVLVTHIDTDHIVGVRQLFREVKKSIVNKVPCLFRPLRLWHNTFDDLIDSTCNPRAVSLTAALQASITSGSSDASAVTALLDASKDRSPPTPLSSQDAHDIAGILAGHADGRELRDLHKFLYTRSEIAELNYPLSSDHSRKLILADRRSSSHELSGLSLRVIGPLRSEIDSLRSDFDRYLREKGAQDSTPLAAYADKSIANLSSIVFLVELNGRSILLTGDARGDKVIEGLELVGLLGAEPLHVDILKIPHHGSDRNVDKKFFSRIQADVYVFSADGSHGNPDVETVQWLIESRRSSDRYTVHFTYPLDVIDAERAKHIASPSSLAETIHEYSARGHVFKVVEGHAEIALGATLPRD